MNLGELTKEETKAFYLMRMQITSLNQKDQKRFRDWVYLDFPTRHHDLFSLWMCLIVGGVFLGISGILLGVGERALVYLVVILIPFIWIYIREHLKGYKALFGFSKMVDCEYLRFNDRISSLMDEDDIQYTVHGVGFRKTRKTTRVMKRVQGGEERLMGYVVKITGTPITVSSWTYPIFDEEKWGTLVHVATFDEDNKTMIEDVKSLIDKVA